MSDKELDLLFKSKFTDYEVEPSVSSWSKIEEQLSVKPMQRRKVPFLWMAAASVVVIFGLGLLLWNKPQEQIMLKGKPAVEEGDMVIAQNNTVNMSDEVITNTQPAEAKVEPVSRVAQEVTPNTIEESNSKEENYLASIPTENPEAKQEFAVTRTDPVKRITVTELMLLEEENEVKTSKIKSTMFSSLSSKDEDNNQSKRIRSVGDLVNFVIAKVDKRENKVLKISKTDESDMEITGINLGLFKYRKD